MARSLAAMMYQEGFDFPLGAIDARTRLLAALGRQRCEPLELLGDLAPLAEVARLLVLEFGDGLRSLEALRGFENQFFEIVHRLCKP